LQLFSDSYSALQVAELKKKQDAQAQLLRQKQKSDEAARRLHEEIQRIKTQKVRFC
jgi:kinesin family protein 4/21/27